MTCTRCGGSGFLNVYQVPKGVEGVEAILAWMKAQKEPHDVEVCDCCGDGEWWHGNAGEHYTSSDPRGKEGPYAYNGGLAECS